MSSSAPRRKHACLSVQSSLRIFRNVNQLVRNGNARAQAHQLTPQRIFHASNTPAPVHYAPRRKPNAGSSNDAMSVNPSGLLPREFISQSCACRRRGAVQAVLALDSADGWQNAELVALDELHAAREVGVPNEQLVARCEELLCDQVEVVPLLGTVESPRIHTSMHRKIVGIPHLTSTDRIN